ncbi:hypothetical protein ACN47A_40770 [Myxococcus fulvus]|uniref:hypothetical protein n=1 Tax=Myxococcus fulvus TaxID=33 RepID=UPI003B9B8837
MAARLRPQKSALKKDWLLKKHHAAEVLESLEEDMQRLGAKPVAKLVENLSHPVATYALALLLKGAPGDASPRTDKKKLSVKKGQLIAGDLRVEGQLVVESHLVVVGNLEARSVTVGESGSLAVGGNLKARRLDGDGWILVHGDVEADLVCGYYEAGEFGVAGTLRSQLTVFSNHGAAIAKNESQHFFDLQDPSPKSKKYKELLARVSPTAVLPEDEDADVGVLQVDFIPLLKRAEAGKPFLRE